MYNPKFRYTLRRDILKEAKTYPGGENVTTQAFKSCVRKCGWPESGLAHGALSDARTLVFETPKKVPYIPIRGQAFSTEFFKCEDVGTADDGYA
jgi:hypothetical protein